MYCPPTEVTITKRLLVSKLRLRCPSKVILPLSSWVNEVEEFIHKKDKVKKLTSSTKALTNIVSLIRHALGEEEVLEPFVVTVEDRFRKWITEQQQNGRKFTPEQEKWLEMIKDHVASSVNIEVSDLENTPFKDKGGAMGAYRVFGDELQKVLEELSGVLAA